MKLSLLVPTFNSAATIERTLRSALAQRHRPLEIVIYDETSRDGTRDIVRRVLGEAARDIETDFLVSESNSGPVRAWRVPLHRCSGDWSCFVWADDVLEPAFSDAMMAGAERAAAAGRKLVFASAWMEADGHVHRKYSDDEGLLDPVEFSLGIFLRRYSVNQVSGVYETAAARRVFDHHIDIPNALGFDYSRYPYGNDVGFLSELAHDGGGVELLRDRLVRLVLSGQSMTRGALRRHLWQFRWQYTYNFWRVWSHWRDEQVPGAIRLVGFAARRLALCALMLRRIAPTPRHLAHSLAAARDFLTWDYERRPRSLDEYRRRLARLRAS